MVRISERNTQTGQGGNMADRTKSIEMLNTAVAMEMQAIHQYMYWHFHLDDQGYKPLAGLFRQTAIAEMMHTEQLAERILFLKGDVKMEPYGPVAPITEPEAIVQQAMEMEREAAEVYNEFARQCAENSDSASTQMFEGMVADEEGHFDVFDTQLEHIKRLGPNYLALQAFGQLPGAGAGAAPA
jgi:bacterioferritin